MAISGLLGSVLFHTSNAHAGSKPGGSQQSGISAFQKLGQDLQSGNLSGAQSDFAALTQSGSSTQLSSNNTIGQALNTLGQALKAGNLTAAQQDFAALKQDVQQAYGSAGVHHHGHHHHSSGSSGQQTDAISVAFGSLGQSLQSGNLSAAQQAYSTIQSDIAQYAAGVGIGGSSTSSTPGQSTSSGFSVSA
ncbi:MAG: hypothetical protein WB780_22630 [Candidatus Acidiferrales bacterium]